MVTSQNKRIHTPPLPFHSKLGCLLFSIGSSNSGTTLHGWDAGKKRYFPLLKSVKRQIAPLKRSQSWLTLSPIFAWHILGPKSPVWLHNPTGLHTFCFWNYINSYNWLPCAQVNALTASCLKWGDVHKKWYKSLKKMLRFDLTLRATNHISYL